MKATSLHVAIIPDGNRRWARQRGLPSHEGHRAGYKAFLALWEACERLAVAHLTCFALSSENFAKRSRAERIAIYAIIEQATVENLPRFQERKIRLRFIGDHAQLPDKLREVIAEAHRAGESFKKTVTIALNYGGRHDIVQACLRAASDPALTPESFSQYLQTAGVPDPDILIRTAGEQRISNFLLWQAAYSELFFVDSFWPDFTPQHLESIIKEYRKRTRRFGA